MNNHRKYFLENRINEDDLELLHGDLIKWGLSDDDAELAIRKNKKDIYKLLKSGLSNTEIIQKLKLTEKYMKHSKKYISTLNEWYENNKLDEAKTGKSYKLTCEVIRLNTGKTEIHYLTLTKVPDPNKLEQYAEDYFNHVRGDEFEFVDIVKVQKL